MLRQSRPQQWKPLKSWNRFQHRPMFLGECMGLRPFSFDRPPTLDWQILDSERIVIANFVSATAAVETLPPETPGYRPMHVLRFRASEYLKGTGPSEFTVEVVDHSPEWHRERRNGVYATEAEALVRATALWLNAIQLGMTAPESCFCEVRSALSQVNRRSHRKQGVGRRQTRYLY